MIVLGEAQPSWAGEKLLGHMRIALLLPPGALLQLLALLLVLIPVPVLAGLLAVPHTLAPRTPKMVTLGTMCHQYEKTQRSDTI